jgi:hypothetical protein
MYERGDEKRKKREKRSRGEEGKEGNEEKAEGEFIPCHNFYFFLSHCIAPACMSPSCSQAR